MNISFMELSSLYFEEEPIILNILDVVDEGGELTISHLPKISTFIR